MRAVTLLALWFTVHGNINTSSPKGNDAHLRAIIQSKREKMETSIFQTLKGSYLCGPWSVLAEFQTHPSSYVCHHYL